MEAESTPLLVILVGLVAVTAMVVRAIMARSAVPALVVFIVMGLALRIAEDRTGMLGPTGEATLELLAQLGVIALLFRIGLESDIRGLLDQIGPASLVWVGNVVLSAVPGYLVVSHLLGYGVVPSLVAAVALSATSVGVSLGMWAQHNAIRTRKGALLTDVAEMDDLSGIALMALIFAIVPLFRAGAQEAVLLPQIASIGGIFMLKLVGFAAVCALLGRFVEERVTRRLRQRESAAELMVFVAGTGILIAGIAEWLGISAAVGALFAGILFSRDPDAVRFDAGFQGLFHLLTPFFFVGVGLGIELSAAGSALWVGLALVTVAVLGKLVGAGLPARLTTTTAGAALIAVSMVPRAEITMIIMSRGRELGDWAVPPELYAGFVIVSAVTCVVAPVVLEILFRRFPGELRDAQSVTDRSTADDDAAT